MKLKLAFSFIIVIAILVAAGCKKQPVENSDSNGTGNGSGGGSGGGNPTNSRPPIADAGPDQLITYLTAYNKATLNGNNSFDSSGMNLQFFWRQISGPSNSFIQSPEQKECTVFNINSIGIYSFELKVWNNNGVDFDTTNVSVAIPSYCQSSRPEIPATLTFVANIPEHTQNPEIVAAGNKLIFPSWFNNSTGTISNNIHIYDRITQQWNTIHTSMARLGVSTIAAGNKVFFAGGVDNWENYTATSVVDIFDLTTNTWTVSNLSEARGYCKTVVSGNKVFFAGGLKNNNTLSNKVDIYDLETNSWSSTSLPGGARAVLGAIASQNKVLFCGGYTAYEDPTGFGMVLTTSSPAIDIYDKSTGQWSASTMAVNKEAFAAVEANGKVYLAGGVVNSAVTFHVEELDVNTMSSSNACLHQPSFSYNVNSAAVRNNMIVFFTYSPFAGIDHHKFDVYNIQTGVWSIGVLQPDLITTNYFTAITSVNNEIYAVIDDKLYKMNL